MSNNNSPIKFNCNFLSRRSPTNAINAQLIKFCRDFVKEGFAAKVDGKFKGNLSYRLEEAFVITPSGFSLDTIAEDDLVRVAKWEYERFDISFIGLMLPSSESFVHAVAYDARPEINAVFHGHSPEILENGERLGLPITENEVEKGTPEEALEVKKLIEKNKNSNFLIIKGHGFISLGKTMAEAMDNCLAMKKKI